MQPRTLRPATRSYGISVVLALVTACAFREPDCAGSSVASDASVVPDPNSPNCNPCDEVCACTPGAVADNGAFFGCPQAMTVCDNSGLWTYDCEGTACDASPPRDLSVADSEDAPGDVTNDVDFEGSPDAPDD